MKKSIVLPLRVSRRIIDFADGEAKRLEISRNEVIRRIIDGYIDDKNKYNP